MTAVATLRVPRPIKRATLPQVAIIVHTSLAVCIKLIASPTSSLRGPFVTGGRIT